MAGLDCGEVRGATAVVDVMRVGRGRLVLVHQRLIDEVLGCTVLTLRHRPADIRWGAIGRIDDETAGTVNRPRHAVYPIVHVCAPVCVRLIDTPHLGQILHVGWRYPPYLRLAVCHRLWTHVHLCQVNVACKVLMSWINHMCIRHCWLQMLQALPHNCLVCWTWPVCRQCC